MNRRKFLQNSCAACLSATALSGILASCQATRYVAGSIGKDGLTIGVNEFVVNGNNKETYRSFLIVRMKHCNTLFVYIASVKMNIQLCG